MILVHSATCIAIKDRAVLIEGPSGSGKSSLALALIDRGAMLVGDDGVTLELRAGRLLASPPPNIAGLLEVRNLGLLPFPVASKVPVALVLRLDPAAPRFVEGADQVSLAGLDLPLLRLWPDDPGNVLKAGLALERFGLGTAKP